LDDSTKTLLRVAPHPTIVIDHPGYCAEAAIRDETRRELLRDLALAE
jgi:hypothetical protein